MFIKNLIHVFKKNNSFCHPSGDVEVYLEICNVIQGKRIKTRYVAEPCEICHNLECEVVSISDLRTNTHYYIVCSIKQVVITNMLNEQIVERK